MASGEKGVAMQHGLQPPPCLQVGLARLLAGVKWVLRCSMLGRGELASVLVQAGQAWLLAGANLHHAIWQQAGRRSCCKRAQCERAFVTCLHYSPVLVNSASSFEFRPPDLLASPCRPPYSGSNSTPPHVRHGDSGRILPTAAVAAGRELPPRGHQHLPPPCRQDAQRHHQPSEPARCGLRRGARTGASAQGDQLQVICYFIDVMRFKCVCHGHTAVGVVCAIV
ncbi:uncharacterized protein [Triticum aestivum]|uniref:uncharacterized protein n=1 Tax=Triticum aestivum TaxID=4565 RepID=UPI001D02A610|nr:uncharacterized protein LOC123076880 [Triticum aestivum]